MKKSLLLIVAIQLSGCGFSTFTQREVDPFVRDWFGNWHEDVAITVTDSSRRLVYDFKKTPNGAVYCADPAPDTSVAVSGVIAGDVSATIPSGTASGTGDLNGSRTSSTSTLPLVRRSQGLQWARDGAATECLLYAMGVTDRAHYLTRLDKIREQANALIIEEIKILGALALGGQNKTDSAPIIPPKEKK